MNEKIYIGETAETFKKRCGGHYTTFNKIAYQNETSLAKHIWDLHNKNITYQVNWEIIDTVNSYRPGNEYCKLCIAEKKWILFYEGSKRLNSNEELIATCRHRRKYLLGRIKNTENVDLLRHTVQNEDQVAVSNDVEIFIPRRSTSDKKDNIMFKDFILN